ncbi:MltR family transcriptional regulator, partial [Salmonella enterica subsp. enterica serovar Montevideo]|nr:MltR family transcriptional regulator [Salmonella enterica subsp. enterica serovar Montevideo]
GLNGIFATQGDISTLSGLCRIALWYGVNATRPEAIGVGLPGHLSVRLKLIYGLGVLSRTEYEDAELLMALREELNHDGNEYAFT